MTSVLARLGELGLPQSIEWVHETTPSLRAAAVAAGVAVGDYPLLVLAGAPVARQSPVAVRRLSGRRPGPRGRAAPPSSRLRPGRHPDGPASVAERDARVAELSSTLDHLSTVLDAGRSVLYGAFDPELGAVGGGSHNPRGDVTEIVGVGVLPAQRRRGIAGHLTWALAEDAAAAGVGTVFMSAGSDDVARIYEGVGFRRVGTACIVG